MFRVVVVTALALMLSGCADRFLKSGGTVYSVFPGVAESMMDWKMARAIHTCPKEASEHKVGGSIERFTTPLTPLIEGFNRVTGTNLPSHGGQLAYQQECD